MKVLVRALVGIAIVIAIVVVVISLNLDSIVKGAIEREATQGLGLRTTVGRVHVSLFGGTVNISDLRIASPPGFSTPNMLELGSIGVAIHYSELRANPKRVDSITIDAPKLTIEQAGGVLNFRKAEQMMPKSPPSKNPIKLVIDKLDMRNGQVIVKPGVPGLQKEVNVAVPALTMKDIGRGKGAQNGAAIRDVAMQVIAALAEHAAQTGMLPADLKGLLHLNVGAAAAKVGSEALKHVEQSVPGGEVGGKLLQQFTGSGSSQPAGRAPATPKR